MVEAFSFVPLSGHNGYPGNSSNGYNLQPLKTYQLYVLSCPQLGHYGLLRVWDENTRKSWFVGVNSQRPERKLKDAGKEFQHTCGVRGVTELCAGNLIINAIITNFLKVIILFAHNPHTQTQKRARTWSSTRATPIALFSPPLLPYLLLWEWTRGVRRRHLFLFHKEKNLQLQQASCDFPPIMLLVIFQVPTAASYDSLSANSLLVGQRSVFWGLGQRSLTTGR